MVSQSACYLQQMIRCAETAGIVIGKHCPKHLANSASPHPLHIVLESEAAALYCLRKAAESCFFRKGDQFMVADVGGGTVDIVVHSVEDDQTWKLREVAMSSGGLCGGTYVDNNFLSYLMQKIPCFRQYMEDNPAGTRNIMKRWEEMKCSFDGSPSWGSQMFELPGRLASAWKNFDRLHNINDDPTMYDRDMSYDEIEITSQDMEAIFDPVVDKVVELIKVQVKQEMKALMVVGGFSASGYLMKQIREEIGKQVKDIINPPDPGSVVCQGAVIFGLHPETMVSRISRKTYGIKMCRLFDPRVDSAEFLIMRDGKPYRNNIFSVFVRRGDVVGMNQCISYSYYTFRTERDCLRISIYSSDLVDPQFTSDPGVQKEGIFHIDISDGPGNLGNERSVLVLMHFGRSCIQVEARRRNFGDTSEVVRLEHTVPFHGCT